MSAISHGWHPPASSGIHVPLKVAQEFHAADKAKAHAAHRKIAMAMSSRGMRK
jgi:hypothetical protein